MIKEFKWKFPSYEKNLIPKDGELIEWLSIMQHFGAPTRLLDFPCPCMLLFLWQWIIPAYQHSSVEKKLNYTTNSHKLS